MTGRQTRGLRGLLILQKVGKVRRITGMQYALKVMKTCLNDYSSELKYSRRTSMAMAYLQEKKWGRDGDQDSYHRHHYALLHLGLNRGSVDGIAVGRRIELHHPLASAPL